MSPLEDLVRSFQDLVAQVPEVVQPLIVLLAGAVPLIEGEGASLIGVVGGIHPVVAGLGAAAGNYLAVVAVVVVSSRARSAVVDHRAARVAVAAGGVATATPTQLPAEPARRESKGRRRFQRWLVRFGVSGASLLGPLAIPTHIASVMLVAAGTPRARVLVWQAVAIALWTTVATISGWVALGALQA